MSVARTSQPIRKRRAYASWELAALLLLLLLGFGLRMVNLTNPPLDFHPTRQLRSAIIARGMYASAQPTAFDDAAREAAIAAWNTMERYEPPLFEQLVAFTYAITGHEILWVARIYAAIFWLIGGLALFVLTRRNLSRAGAFAALAFYLILPWGVTASRSFQPDPLMVMGILLTALACDAWMRADAPPWRAALAAGVLGGLTVLIKVMAVYAVGALLAGCSLWVLWQKRERLRTQILPILLAALPSIAIPAIYYLGLGARSSEFASFWIVSFAGLLGQSKFYVRWLGLIRGIMDVMIFFAALAGALLASGRARVTALSLWFGYFAIGLTFPFQIYTHDYYSLLLVPAAALGLAPLADAIWRRARAQPFLWRAAFLALVLGVTAYYAYVGRSVLVAANYVNEPIPWQRMADLIPRDGNMIALTHDYGSRLKYYSGLIPTRIWPSGGDLELAAAAGSDRIGEFDGFFAAQTDGMDYFLVTLFGDLEAQPLLKARLEQYPVAAQGDGFIVYDLRSTP